MNGSKSSNLRILSIVITSYMLLAFGWWTILLLNKNAEVYQSRMANIDQTSLVQKYSVEEIEKDFKNQRLMIISEGLVFIFALLIGIWLINRGHAKELDGIRQKRNFLLAITHELKSPLASIRLTLETFKKRNLAPVDKAKLSTNALKETDRLTGLIDNLLLAAKLDKSYQPIFEDYDLVDLLNEVRIDLLNLHPTSDIRIELPNSPMIIRMDKQGMYSLLYNLCENAIKYSQGQESVRIKATHNEHELIIQIIDKGVGISAEDKKKIFNQFYRAGSEETRQTTGTGLGLYIASRMVAIHQGRISVSDNKPRGSIFSIIIPQ